MPASFDLDGKVALVTGAASGIGKSVAGLFASSGARVFEVDIAFSKEEESNTAFSRKSFHVDVTSSAEVRKAMDELYGAYKRLDVVVNCAGIEMAGNVVDLPEESFDRVMRTNVKGAFLVLKYAIPIILKSTDRGSVVNVASDLGIQPIPGTDAYAASKGAIISLTKALSKNWAGKGLRVNCIAPGPIETPLLHRFQSEETLDLVKKTMIPLGRLGTTEEVANAALFLASDASSFVNGAVLTVNGGLLG